MYLSKRGLRGYVIVASNCLHGVKVQDIKEVFNLAANNIMGTKDVRIQAENTYQAFFSFFLAYGVNIQ